MLKPSLSKWSRLSVSSDCFRDVLGESQTNDAGSEICSLSRIRAVNNIASYEQSLRQQMRLYATMTASWSSMAYVIRIVRLALHLVEMARECLLDQLTTLEQIEKDTRDIIGAFSSLVVQFPDFSSRLAAAKSLTCPLRETIRLVRNVIHLTDKKHHQLPQRISTLPHGWAGTLYYLAKKEKFLYQRDVKPTVV